MAVGIWDREAEVDIDETAVAPPCFSPSRLSETDRLLKLIHMGTATLLISLVSNEGSD